MSDSISSSIWQEGLHTCIRLQIRPNSSKDALKILRDSVIEISVKAKAEGGKANDRLIKFLSKALNLPETLITIRHGHTSKKKVLILRNTSAQLVVNKFHLTTQPSSC
jgi:uncharacterized protein